MILEAILSLVGVLIKFVFNLLPNLPTVPVEVSNLISEYVDLICSNCTFISFFLDVSYVKVILALLIALFGFRQAYKFTMWIYHKLPLSSE